MCPQSTAGTGFAYSLYFCPTSNKSLTKKGVFFYIFALILTKPYQKGCFLYFCCNPNQSLATKVVCPCFALILTKILPKRVFFCIFALILTKPYQKGCFTLFLPLTVILTKALPKRVIFFIFCPYINKSPIKNGVG